MKQTIIFKENSFINFGHEFSIGDKVYIVERHRGNPAAVRKYVLLMFSHAHAFLMQPMNYEKFKDFKGSTCCGGGNMLVSIEEVMTEEMAEKQKDKENQTIWYSEDKKTLIRCPDNFEGTFKIPDGVTKITDNAFFACEKLTEVIIPESVKKLERKHLLVVLLLQQLSFPRA